MSEELEPSEFYKAAVDLAEFHIHTTTEAEVLTDLLALSAALLGNMLARVPRQQRVLMRKEVLASFSQTLQASTQMMIEERKQQGSDA